MQQLQLIEVDEDLQQKYELVNENVTDIYTILAGENRGPLTNSQRIAISSKLALKIKIFFSYLYISFKLI